MSKQHHPPTPVTRDGQRMTAVGIRQPDGSVAPGQLPLPPQTQAAGQQAGNEPSRGKSRCIPCEQKKADRQQQQQRGQQPPPSIRQAFTYLMESPTAIKDIFEDAKVYGSPFPGSRYVAFATTVLNRLGIGIPFVPAPQGFITLLIAGNMFRWASAKEEPQIGDIWVRVDATGNIKLGFVAKLVEGESGSFMSADVDMEKRPHRLSYDEDSPVFPEWFWLRLP